MANKKSSKKARKQQSVPDKPLPVTLLSGFLGSGKTTLLQHILTSDHGLRIAVVVNDIGAINVDANLIQQTHRLTKTEEKVIALQNGCICCTLRGDLLEELVHLAELRQFDYVIIESSGISEPEQVAETFDPRLASQMSLLGEGPEGLDEDMLRVIESVRSAGGLEKFAKLDTTVTVIDAFTIYHDFHTDHLLSSRREDVTPEDERTVSDLLVDQIEFADVIILNKIDMVDDKAQKRIIDLVTSLNHSAKLIKAKFGRVAVEEIVNTKRFNFDQAKLNPGWLQDLHQMTLREVNGRKAITPKPETEEYNVGNFIYVKRRPFHPRRLWKLVYDKFILQLEYDEEDEEDDEDMADGEAAEEEEEEEENTEMDVEEDLYTPSNEVILANKAKDPLFKRLFRSKGEICLATRPHQAGEWSQAGAMLTIRGGRPWFCILPEEEYTTGDAEVDKLVKYDLAMGGEWGDRRQEIVFIGEGLDKKGLEAALDECVLTDDEFETWQDIMRKGETMEKTMEALNEVFDDGFPDWPADEGHEDHDH